MPANDPNYLIGGHIFGSLTKSEAEQLVQRAMQDDDSLEELYEAEAMKAQLEDPRFRAQVRAALEQGVRQESPGFWESLSALFTQRWVLPAATFAAIALMVAIFVPFGQEETSTMAVALSQTGPEVPKAAGVIPVSGDELNKWLSSRQTPPAKKAKVTIGFDRDGAAPSYALGDQQRIGFRLQEDARVVVLEERADGSIVRLFPSVLQSDSLVRAGGQVLVPPDGQGNMTVEGPAGKRKLRVLLFPVNVDPLASDQSWDALQKSAAGIERQYEVKP